MCMLPVQRLGAQQMAVHANALTTMLGAPSVGVEFVVGNRFSLNADVTASPRLLWMKPWKFAAFQPEFRYWLSGRPMHRLFVGVGAIASIYDFKMRNKNRIGTAAGGGVTFGYSWSLSRHWTVTASAGCALVGYWQKEYFIGDKYDEYTFDGMTKVNATGMYFMPSNAGVTFSYLIK